MFIITHGKSGTVKYLSYLGTILLTIWKNGITQQIINDPQARGCQLYIPSCKVFLINNPSTLSCPNFQSYHPRVCIGEQNKSFKQSCMWGSTNSRQSLQKTISLVQGAAK